MDHDGIQQTHMPGRNLRPIESYICVSTSKFSNSYAGDIEGGICTSSLSVPVFVSVLSETPCRAWARSLTVAGVLVDIFLCIQ